MLDTKHKEQTPPSNRTFMWFSSLKVCIIWGLYGVATGAIIAGIFALKLDKELIRLLNIRQTILKTTYSLDDLKNPESINETLYVVYNPRCQIPNYPPFHEEVKPYFMRMKPVVCSTRPVLTSIVHKNLNNTLRLHKKRFQRYYNGSAQKPVCCYSVISITLSNLYRFSKCKTFNRSIELQPWIQAVSVECKVRGTLVYRNMHFVVAVDNVRHKLELLAKGNHSAGVMSVMIVGIDSVSKQSLARTMPKTHMYLENNAWYALQGYHKVNANTLYNLGGPVLTGYAANQLLGTCVPNESNKTFGSCPWIWKNFSDKNYLTAYGEDGVDTFAFSGRFAHRPTDYYMRPFIQAAQHAHAIWQWYPLCVGPMKIADSVLDFSVDFASKFVNQPSFSLFWMNSFSHENLNGPSMMDQKFLAYFNSLKSSGVLNRSMIVFMSDHGFQRGKFRETYMGAVEDSLPFLYIWLPEWFKNKHPTKVRNIAKNKNMLTSHFDLHLTLMDVLGLKTAAAGCPKCVSLFDLVPWNRSCADAGIAEDSCACTRYDEIRTDSSLVKRMATLAIKQVNNQAASYAAYLQNGTKCSKFTVKIIKSARRQVLRNLLSFKKSEYAKIFQSFKDKMSSYFQGKHYVIHVETDPSNAIFEARILHNLTLEVKSITRLDTYQEHSYCMTSRFGKMYCNCEQALAKNTSSLSYIGSVKNTDK